jgi:hypothetical protein
MGVTRFVIGTGRLPPIGRLFTELARRLLWKWLAARDGTVGRG